MCLGQAIVRLGLCMFDFGGMWRSSFGSFTPHLCLVSSMHGSCTRCLFAGWFAHELVFSGLSWPTPDKPFWLDVGNNFLSLALHSKTFLLRSSHPCEPETPYAVCALKHGSHQPLCSFPTPLKILQLSSDRKMHESLNGPAAFMPDCHLQLGVMPNPAITSTFVKKSCSNCIYTGYDFLVCAARSNQCVIARKVHRIYFHTFLQFCATVSERLLRGQCLYIPQTFAPFHI